MRSERKGNKHEEQRTHLVEQAAALSQAKTALDAQARLARFTPQWYEHAPRAVTVGCLQDTEVAMYLHVRRFHDRWLGTT